MVVGMNALWLAPLFGPVDKSILVLIPTAALASLLPDIDASAAKIHFVGGGFLGIFRGIFFGKYFHHRGLTHSLFVTLLLLLIIRFFWGDAYPALPYVFAASYFSHPLVDGLNSGVGYFYPFILKRYALVPKVLRTPVGGVIDNLLFFIAALGIILFFIGFKDQFIPRAGQWFN